jgi:hypothetical protein
MVAVQLLVPAFYTTRVPGCYSPAGVPLPGRFGVFYGPVLWFGLFCRFRFFERSLFYRQLDMRVDLALYSSFFGLFAFHALVLVPHHTPLVTGLGRVDVYYWLLPYYGIPHLRMPVRVAVTGVWRAVRGLIWFTLQRYCLARHPVHHHSYLYWCGRSNTLPSSRWFAFWTVYHHLPFLRPRAATRYLTLPLSFGLVLPLAVRFGSGTAVTVCWITVTGFVWTPGSRWDIPSPPSAATAFCTCRTAFIRSIAVYGVPVLFCSFLPSPLLPGSSTFTLPAAHLTCLHYLHFAFVLRRVWTPHGSCGTNG